MSPLSSEFPVAESDGMQVRDWYVESFKELREFKPIRDAESELKFTGLLRHIYHRHRYGPSYSHVCQ